MAGGGGVGGGQGRGSVCGERGAGKEGADKAELHGRRVAGRLGGDEKRRRRKRYAEVSGHADAKISWIAGSRGDGKRRGELLHPVFFTDSLIHPPHPP